MPRVLYGLSLAAVLTTGAATAMAAGADVTSQSMTGTQTGSQQVGTPATGGDYRTGTQSAYPKGATGMNAQSGQYPGKVGPTGSNQPDATNPNRSSPTGGGSQESNSSESGTSSR